MQQGAWPRCNCVVDGCEFGCGTGSRAPYIAAYGAVLDVSHYTPSGASLLRSFRTAAHCTGDGRLECGDTRLHTGASPIGQSSWPTPALHCLCCAVMCTGCNCAVSCMIGCCAYAFMIMPFLGVSHTHDGEKQLLFMLRLRPLQHNYWCHMLGPTLLSSMRHTLDNFAGIDVISCSLNGLVSA